MIRRNRKSFSVTSCAVLFFIFIIVYNFYVNVWSTATMASSTSAQPATLLTRSGNSQLQFVWAKESGYHRTDNGSSNRKITGLHRSKDDPFTSYFENSTVKLVLEKPSFENTPTSKPTPTLPTVPAVWPDLDNFDDDRILTQLTYKPDWVRYSEHKGKPIHLKKILLYTGFSDWDVKPGRQTFIEQKCPVSTCSLTENKYRDHNADAIIFRQSIANPPFYRPPHQIRILFLLESAIWKIPKNKVPVFNWTATYRRDSDIVTPYEKFVLHNEAIVSKLQNRNYASGKRKQVAWFVSNCDTVNKRMEYARELSRHIQVDIYGRCGRKKCTKNACFELLNKEYKFYLSFENSNCRDYISEKFFVTGLQHDVIPVVMGAHIEDYQRVAPHKSFIHVDQFDSPKQLAEYLHILDKNDDLYNEYFQWKGTGTFINTYFWCRVCAMLHDTTRGAKSYGDIASWWQGPGVCAEKSQWKHKNKYITKFYNESD